MNTININTIYFYTTEKQIMKIQKPNDHIKNFLSTTTSFSILLKVLYYLILPKSVF